MSERKFTTYSKEFKEMAAKLYLEGGMSYKTLIEELGIGGITPAMKLAQVA